MPKIVTIEEVRRAFEKEGCLLLEDAYTNNVFPLNYVCSCGTRAQTTWARFRRGSRCQNCGLATAKSKKKLDQHAVEALFAAQGCKLLEAYINSYTPVRYTCSCGNESLIRLSAFKRGQRCEKCDGGRGETHYNWNPNREEVAWRKKFRQRQGHLLRYVLNQTGKTKTQKTQELLGYSCEDLKNHIFSHPNWPKVKDGEWHIDHIFPIKAFLDYGIHDVNVINALENLQPLSGPENLKKNRFYDTVAFEAWMDHRLGTKTTNVKGVMKGDFDLILS